MRAVAAVTKCKSTPHNNLEERKSSLHCAGSLSSRNKSFFLKNGKDTPFRAALALVYQTVPCHNT